jgi:hypothetical protein
MFYLQSHWPRMATGSRVPPAGDHYRPRSARWLQLAEASAVPPAGVRGFPGLSHTASVYRRLLKLTLEELRVTEARHGSVADLNFDRLDFRCKRD